uniref:(northern house mosquito) hypothetical protein n=1 Tax=Culex pipiens TaxID=7175 RepID=A0A8D8HK02_CULPI
MTKSTSGAWALGSTAIWQETHTHPRYSGQGPELGRNGGSERLNKVNPKGRHWDVIIHHDRREVATCHGSRQRDVPIQPAWCQRDATIQSKFNSDKVKVHSG